MLTTIINLFTFAFYLLILNLFGFTFGQSFILALVLSLIWIEIQLQTKKIELTIYFRNTKSSDSHYYPTILNHPSYPKKYSDIILKKFKSVEYVKTIFIPHRCIISGKIDSLWSDDNKTFILRDQGIDENPPFLPIFGGKLSKGFIDNDENEPMICIEHTQGVIKCYFFFQKVALDKMEQPICEFPDYLIFGGFQNMFSRFLLKKYKLKKTTDGRSDFELENEYFIFEVTHS